MAQNKKYSYPTSSVPEDTQKKSYPSDFKFIKTNTQNYKNAELPIANFQQFTYNSPYNFTSKKDHQVNSNVNINNKKTTEDAPYLKFEKKNSASNLNNIKKTQKQKQFQNYSSSTFKNGQINNKNPNSNFNKDQYNFYNFNQKNKQQGNQRQNTSAISDLKLQKQKKQKSEPELKLNRNWSTSDKIENPNLKKDTMSDYIIQINKENKENIIKLLKCQSEKHQLIKRNEAKQDQNRKLRKELQQERNKILIMSKNKNQQSSSYPTKNNSNMNQQIKLKYEQLSNKYKDCLRKIDELTFNLTKCQGQLLVSQKNNKQLSKYFNKQKQINMPLKRHSSNKEIQIETFSKIQQLQKKLRDSQRRQKSNQQFMRKQLQSLDFGNSSQKNQLKQILKKYRQDLSLCKEKLVEKDQIIAILQKKVNQLTHQLQRQQQQFKSQITRIQSQKIIAIKSSDRQIAHKQKTIQLLKLQSSTNIKSQSTILNPQPNTVQQMIRGLIQQSNKLRTQVALRVQQNFTLRTQIIEGKAKITMIQNQIAALKARTSINQNNNNQNVNIKLLTAQGDVESFKKKIDTLQQTLGYKKKQIQEKDKFIQNQLLRSTKKQDLPMLVKELQRIFGSYK